MRSFGAPSRRETVADPRTAIADGLDDVRYEPPMDFSPLLIESLAKRDEVLAKIEVVRQILTSKEPSIRLRPEA